MPLHLIKNFYIAKDFVDCLQAKQRVHLPALRAKDFAIVLQYIKLLSPVQE